LYFANAAAAAAVTTLDAGLKNGKSPNDSIAMVIKIKQFDGLKSASRSFVKRPCNDVNQPLMRLKNF
jgi:hypothetical protein